MPSLVEGKASIIMYVAAVPLAFVNQVISDALYAVVALMWLAPGTRIEKRIKRREGARGPRC